MELLNNKRPVLDLVDFSLDSSVTAKLASLVC